MFLMHRVELKARSYEELVFLDNVFLMHRVELKVSSWINIASSFVVPNAPCGVERNAVSYSPLLTSLFLMHRVELKDLSSLQNSACQPGS